MNLNVGPRYRPLDVLGISPSCKVNCSLRR
jgi:hypothetical protein